jgi:parafibromin
LNFSLLVDFSTSQHLSILQQQTAKMSQSDPLLVLRQAIEAGDSPVLSTSADSSATDAATTLAQAKYIHFPQTSISFGLEDDTRFRPGDKTIDLRSIYFAWLNKDASAQDYIQSVQLLNEEMTQPGGSGGVLQSLVFTERLDLNSWLSGLQDESEYIMPLAPTQMSAISAVSKPSLAQPITVDARLLQIYAGERRILDRTTILHGSKPTDFSSVRRQAQQILARANSKTASKPDSIPAAPSSTTLVANQKKPSRSRPQPIILLSPSASALLRMSNIKRFLEEGVFVPADSALAPSTGADRLQVTRTMTSIDPSRPFLFHVVESPDRFKPEDWARLVAVFTTGQAWQFKAYRWSSAAELFARVLGIYVGWNGESVPDTVKGWGRSVKVVGVDKWSGKGESGRWKDREVVEAVWTSIEESMRSKGWTKESGPK